MGRIATGWQLAKRSLAVVRSDGSLSSARPRSPREVGRAARRHGFDRPALRLLGIVPALALGGLGIVSGSTEVLAILLVVAVAIVIAAAVLGSAARAVFSVALYRYASGAAGTGPFTPTELESAVARKR